MSSEVASSSTNASQKQTAWSWKIQNFAKPHNFPTAAVSDVKWGASLKQTTNGSSSTPSTMQGAPVKSQSNFFSTAARKRRKLNGEEDEIKHRTAASIALSLEADHILTLYPDTDTPFERELDVISRLLPYHIFQHPKHDLDSIRGRKGKGKATEEDMLREELKETRFAIDCHNRLRALDQRLRRTRLKAGKRPTPSGQAIALERLVLEADHAATSAMDQELASARSELDKTLRAQRVAKMNANRYSSYQSPGNAYYGYSNPTFSAAPSSSVSQYYNSYTYPYGQSNAPNTSYSGPTSAKVSPSTSSIPGASSFQTINAPSGKQAPTTASNCPISQPSPFTTNSVRPPPVAIPLQIPVTSLPALQALGILPVPKAALPPRTEPQPAAVLLGSTNNGNMLSLEINAALLQAPQMSGLAILLSSLVKMSGGTSSNSRNTGPVSVQSQTGGAIPGTAVDSQSPSPSNAAYVSANAPNGDQNIAGKESDA